MAKNKKIDEFGGLLTEKQKTDLQNMIDGMLNTASELTKEYNDLDISELNALSGSITQISEDSPFLNNIFEGESWKKVTKKQTKK